MKCWHVFYIFYRWYSPHEFTTNEVKKKNDNKNTEQIIWYVERTEYKQRVNTRKYLLKADDSTIFC